MQDFEFTYENYLNMARKLRGRGYSFAFFAEAEKLLAEKKMFVLMRHDVDLDLDRAAALAAIESEEGIAATYFFLVRTEHYNIYSRRGTEAVKRILGGGHALGLHFDCAAYPKNASVEDLSRACSVEASMLADWFGSKVSVVSYHRPGPLVLTGNPALSAPLPHTYMPMFTKDIAYFSDSRGAWTRGAPSESPEFEQGKPLHILAHPVWWNARPARPLDSLHNLCEKKADDFERSLATNCTIFREGDKLA